MIELLARDVAWLNGCLTGVDAAVSAAELQELRDAAESMLETGVVAPIMAHLPPKQIHAGHSIFDYTIHH